MKQEGGSRRLPRSAAAKQPTPQSKFATAQASRLADAAEVEWARHVVFPDGVHRHRRVGDVADLDGILPAGTYIRQRALTPRPTWGHRVVLATMILAEQLAEQDGAA